MCSSFRPASRSVESTAVNAVAAQDGSPAQSERKGREQDTASAAPTPHKLTDLCGVPADAVCCLILVIVGPIIVVQLISIQMRSGPKKNAAALVASVDFFDSCIDSTSPGGCQNATLYPLDAMNPRVNPCIDFHEHVCGWWRARDPDRGTYLQEHMRVFNHHVAHELVSRAAQYFGDSSGTPRSLEDQMALFYTSCSIMAAGYAKKGSATSLLRTLGIDVRDWVDVRGFGAFLELAVTTTLKSGLASFLRIQFFIGAELRIDVGDTLVSACSLDSRRARIIGVDLFEDIGATLSSAQVNFSTIFEIDAVVENIRVKPNDRTWKVVGDLGDLGEISPYVKWAEALERGLAARLKSAEKWKAVEIRGASVIRNIIDALRTQPLPCASVYTLFILLSQVMKYAPTLGMVEEEAHGASTVPPCLQVTAMHFDRFYPLWVARTLQHRTQVDEARKLFQDIASAIRNDSRVNGGLLIDTRRLSRAQLVMYDESGNDSLPTEPLPADMGQSFLSNVAAVVAAKVGQRPAPSEHWQDQLRGHLGYRDDGRFLISSAYVSGIGAFADLSADKDHEITTTYATLGVLVLRSILDSDAVYFPSWARSHIDRCFALSASSVLGRPVATGVAKDIMRFRWSAQLAWLLKQRQSRKYSASELKKTTTKRSHRKTKAAVKTTAKRVFPTGELFFRLLCFSHCGQPYATEVCNDLAGYYRRFSDVFQCPARPDERSGTCDCYGLHHCETHLPALSALT